MTKAYSYIRFSSIGQKKGRSFERQAEAARKWCAENDIELSEETFTDEGKSGFRAEHLGDKGQLKRFLTKVEDGSIAKGSYLIIESLDRLSRQKVNEALPLFMQILNAGINIVTLLDGEKVYTKDFTAQDVIMSVFVMARANEESDTKSKRAKDKWESRYRQARETGQAVRMPLASWLTYGEDGNYALKLPEADAVRRMFELCSDGYGMIQIAKTLEAEGFKPFRSDKFEGKKWITASVYGILKNKAAIGSYIPNRSKKPDEQAPEVENYFPAVVGNELFYRAQEAIAGRKQAKATNQSKQANIWQGVAVCSHCGSTLHCLPKGRNGMRYLVCSGKVSGKCTEAKNVRADASEEAFKELLVKVDSMSLIKSDKATLLAQLQAVDGKLQFERQQMQKHTEAASKFASDYIYALIVKTEGDIKKLVTEKAELESKLAQDLIAEDDKEKFFSLLDLKSYEARQRANALLKRLGILVEITGGNEPVYIASRPEEIHFPHPDGGTVLFSNRRNFLQLVSRKEGIVIVPLTADQRVKAMKQDPTGDELAKVDDWLASLGLFSRRPVNADIKS
jgi:DNA invertase Pin-like site-specific DNA recombinase